MPNHEDMWSSEHQSCLSKGVTGKIVIPLELQDRVLSANRKSHLSGGFSS
jgi:hypothetical protein